ncbi:hypothetical protein [Aquimonas sp.]|uniref:hypothetical protein n=1 Tax=Aquimonas sp. TaxID=1872588 RepID=UPI0037BF735B
MAAAEVEQELGQHQQCRIGAGELQLIAAIEASRREIELVAAERVNPFETACSPDSCHSFS